MGYQRDLVTLPACMMVPVDFRFPFRRCDNVQM